MTSAAQWWLAEQVVTAEYLLAIACGEPEHARSRLATSAKASKTSTTGYCVDAGKVSYQHPEFGTGVVPVRRLITLATECRT